MVDSLVRDLGAQQTPCLRVYNKSDLFWGDLRPHGEDEVNISAKTGEGVDRLLELIGRKLDRGVRPTVSESTTSRVSSTASRYRSQPAMARGI